MRVSYVVRVVVVGVGICAAAAWAAEPGINLNTKLASQKVAVHVATANPTAVVVRAKGPVLNANINLQSSAGDCSELVRKVALGICVPIGPDDPVSPN
ncbi:MAG: hypothetical protein V4607_09955 [Pseudomonadota bacterium]